MIPTLFALVVLFVGVPLNLYVAIRLRRLARTMPRNSVLRERSYVALAILLVSAVFGLIFLNNDLPNPPLAFDATKWSTRAAMVVLTVGPALYWLRLYRDWS